MNDDDVRARSNGRVLSPVSFDPIFSVPEKAGLCCASIFGPVAWYPDAEVDRKLRELEARHLEYEAFEAARRELFEPRLRAIADDDRREHCGHIELWRPVSARSLVLVVPPGYRRFRWLPAEETRTRARAQRAELLALAASDDWPYQDSLETLLGEAGLDDPEAIESLEGGLAEAPLNAAYRLVVNLDRRLRGLVKLGAPEGILDPESARLHAALADLGAEVHRSDEIPASLKAFF